MKIKSRWLVCTMNEGGRIGNFGVVFDGFYPSVEQIRKYNDVNNCVIVSMQRTRWGKHARSIFIGK